MKLLLLPLLLALGAITASGDPAAESHRRSGPRVTVYQHADFRGDSLSFYPGDSLDNLADQGFAVGGPSNDRISSIRLEGGAEVLVHEDSRYRGRVLRLRESVHNLADRLLPESVGASWNDRISSLRVEPPRAEVRGGRDDRDRPPTRAQANAIIRNAFRDLLVREPDLTGPNVYRDLIMTQGWTDQMVRDNIRRGEEFRLEGADRIIKQAFVEVLGRVPDPSGTGFYRDRLLHHNWTGKEVRDHLRTSEEYRNRHPGR